MPLVRIETIERDAVDREAAEWRQRRSREKRLRRLDHAGMASVCQSKILYATWHGAWRACDRIGRRHARVRNEPYRCVCCGGIHIRTNSGAESLRLTPR